MNETLEVVVKDLNNISDNMDYIIEEIESASLNEDGGKISDAIDYAIAMIETSMYRLSCVRDKLRANF